MINHYREGAWIKQAREVNEKRKSAITLKTENFDEIGGKITFLIINLKEDFVKCAKLKLSQPPAQTLLFYFNLE